MDKNSIVGIILIAAIFILFGVFNTQKTRKAYEDEIRVADSLFDARNYEAAKLAYRKALTYKENEDYVYERIYRINSIIIPDTASTYSATTNETKPEETKRQMVESVEKTVVYSDEEVQNMYGAFSSSVSGENSFINLENDKVKIELSTLGGRVYSVEIKNYQTHDSLPLILFDSDSTEFGLRFFTIDNKPIETKMFYFKPVKEKTSFNASNTKQSVPLRLEVSEDRYIEFLYTLEPGSFMVDLDITLYGMDEIIAGNLNNLDLNWEIFMPQQEKGRQNENNYSSLKYKFFEGEVTGFRMRSSKDVEEEDIPTKIKWVGFKDQFFSSVIIADNFFTNGYMRTEQLDSEKYFRKMRTELGIPYEGKNEERINLRFYFGPNHFQTLKKYGLELKELVYLGKNIIRFINQYVIITLFNWLNNFIGNYGIIILILTIIIKMGLFPFTFKSYMSQAKMRVLKPQVDEINAKFPKKEDAMKKQQAVMALYKRAGASPMGGCLPMLLQMPVLFAMFRFFPSSIELRQEGFLWAHDLSTYDSILNLPFEIPMYGDHVSLFTLLMTVSTIITMKINSPATESTQMPGMKGMMYIMPVMFMLILNKFSAGLTYYYFLANIITFGQNLITKRFIDEEAILKKLQENKKKPAQKSKWQKRLEAAAKS
ncbi:MAG: membrane protein insertase YidC, partial [Bacteroidetes bacterium]|nr:membrane protein insertase YidC [Bacteroidota bacterium]